MGDGDCFQHFIGYIVWQHVGTEPTNPTEKWHLNYSHSIFCFFFFSKTPWPLPQGNYILPNNENIPGTNGARHVERFTLTTIRAYNVIKENCISIFFFKRKSKSKRRVHIAAYCRQCFRYYCIQYAIQYHITNALHLSS